MRPKQVNEVLWSSDGKLMYLAIQGGAIEVGYSVTMPFESPKCKSNAVCAGSEHTQYVQVLEYPSFQHLQTVIGHGQSAHVYHLRLDPSGRYKLCSAALHHLALHRLVAVPEAAAFDRCLLTCIGLLLMSSSSVQSAADWMSPTADHIVFRVKVLGIQRLRCSRQPVGHLRHGVRQDVHRV
jgi:hypothetical protein